MFDKNNSGFAGFDDGCFPSSECPRDWRELERELFGGSRPKQRRVCRVHRKGCCHVERVVRGEGGMSGEDAERTGCCPECAERMARADRGRRCPEEEGFRVVGPLEEMPEDGEVLSPSEMQELEDHWDELMRTGRYDFKPGCPEVEDVRIEEPEERGGKVKVNVTVKVSVTKVQLMQRRPYIWGVPGYMGECFGF